MDKHQKIAKLARMCEEASKFAKKSELQVFCLYEEKDRRVGQMGHYSESMLVNLAYWLAKEHPSVISRARMVLIEEMGVERVKEAEEAPIEPKMEVVQKED